MAVHRFKNPLGDRLPPIVAIPGNTRMPGSARDFRSTRW
jgi:hypothetical protein